MSAQQYPERLKRCSHLMKEAGLSVLLLTKPSNRFYLTGDGRLCAYAMITQGGKVALGVPQTDVMDVKQLAHFDHIVGFDDEVGMIHSIAHNFEHFGIKEGILGLEYTFLTQSMMGMLTHPHAKPTTLTVKDCTHLLSELRIVKHKEEIKRIKAAAKVAVKGMKAAVAALKPGMTEARWQPKQSMHCDELVQKSSGALMSPLVPARILPMVFPHYVNYKPAIW
ncbi:MAG: aminopeptidase P family N-terminal domain-containing protein [Desulfobacterales bacterium]|nr:aminopeptidase P family N-terminal domain-containing protein [Desulfobacterales bacterium]